MNLDYKELLPKDFSADSRVWIYQCDRLFTLGEALEVEELLHAFASNWQSHGAKVKGYAGLLFGQFIVLMADESAAGVSGCSTDSSVRVIKQVEEMFKVTLFDRLLLAFFNNGKIQLLPLSQLGYAVTHNFVNSDTLYFNNTVQTKEALLTNWIIPVKDSWLAKKIQPVLSGK